MKELVPISEIKESRPCEIDDMNELFILFYNLETVCEAQDGIGLHAAQVGCEENIFVVRSPGGYRYFLNCDYEPMGNKVRSMEGCLSLREENGTLRLFEVDRYDKVRVVGQQLVDTELQDVDFEVDGSYAFVFQHEIDHGAGKMISDHGEEIYIWE